MISFKLIILQVYFLLQAIKFPHGIRWFSPTTRCYRRNINSELAFRKRLMRNENQENLFQCESKNLPAWNLFSWTRSLWDPSRWYNQRRTQIALDYFGRFLLSFASENHFTNIVQSKGISLRTLSMKNKSKGILLKTGICIWNIFNWKIIPLSFIHAFYLILSNFPSKIVKWKSSLDQPVRNSITSHFVLTSINKSTILVADRFASATHKHHTGPIITDPCQNFQLIQRWLTIIGLTRLSLLYDVLDRFHKWKFDLLQSLMCMNHQHYLRNCKKYWSYDRNLTHSQVRKISL